MNLAATKIKRTDDAARRVGRPPSVSAPAIIAVAIDIGLDRFTLKQVADRLGVAVATLYRHVANRDELIRLASFQLALTRRLPSDGDRHWSLLATAYAESLFDSFVAEPQLVHELVKGRFGPDVEIAFLEPFLAALARQGFTPAEGVRLHHAVAMLAIGAAVGAIARKAGSAVEPSYETAMHRVLAERRATELPFVRAALREYLDADPGQWLSALHELLAGMAAARGETLPPPARARAAPKTGKPNRSGRAAG